MAAKAEDTRFQNLTVDHHAIMNLAPARRVELLDSSEGRSMLSSLTPQQLQSAFPYQCGRDDATGQKLKSITTGKAQEPQPGDKSGVDATVKNNLGGGRGRSDPGAKAQLTAEQKETFELLKKGEISADDPRVGFIKKLSVEDLKKVGIEKIEQEGKQSYRLSPTKTSEMSDEAVAVALRSSQSTGFSAREQATLDLISKREGASNPDIVFGDRGGTPGSGKYSKALGLDKRPLSDMSVAEVLQMQRKLTQLTAADGVAGGKGTSAVGTGQMVRGTLESNLRDLGIPQDQWGNIKFDKTLQQRLTLQNFKSSGIGDPNSDPSTWNTARLGAQYESLDTRKGFKGMSEAERRRIADATPDRPTLNAEYSPDDIRKYRESLQNRELSARAESLAGIVGRQQQASAADVTVNRKADTQAKVYYAGDSIGVGVGTAAGGVKLAQNGLKFTDPAVLQQLAKVPKGSTVELHGGTNDAVAGITDPDAYREQMKRIAELANANGITVNVNGPPKSKKNWDANAEATDSAMAAAAQEHGLSYRSLRQYTPPEKSDGVHFDNKGYQAMVRPLADPVQPSAPEQQAQTKTQPVPAPEQQAQAQAQTEPVPNMADGGEMETDADQLQVYALDKNKLQRDDSIALDGDGKPQFTMNSKESMKFDPNTGKVEVDNGSKGYKNDPKQLGPEPQQQTQSEKSIDENSIQQPTQPQAQPMPTSTDTGHNTMYESVSLTENIFKTPSFERAIARTRFQNSGDTALGGHFDGGSYGV